MHVALIGAELEENLALRYLWGALERAGHRVTFVAFDEEEQLEAAAAELARSGAELAGLSMVFTYRAREFAALAERSRALGFRGHLVAGGHFAAFHAEQLLRDAPAIDSVVCGEGEEPLVRLAAGPSDLGAVAGLVWRDRTGIVRNRSAEKPPELDSLAEPKRMVPFDEFLGLRICNMLASRGCTHGCAFCSIAAWHRLCGGDRLRMRSAAAVADEMARLYGQGVRIFNFHDDNFILPDREQMLARVATLQSELTRRGVGEIAFAVKSRPDAVDEELFAALKGLGLFRVFLGIEAGSAASLAQLGRGQTVAANERALAIVNRLDLHACFNLLLFNPDSSLADVAANVSFLKSHPQNPMNFCRTEIYAGTPLERRLRRQGRLRGDYWGWDYDIADPRAQLAFEIVSEAFDSRNYGEHCLHHRAMHVDYEHQLLAQFFGTEPGLRRRIKQYVATVNTNTCAHLEVIVAGVAAGRGHGEDRARWLHGLARDLEADNRRLMAVGDGLLDEIGAQAEARAITSGRWARTATAAAVAATLSLSVAACDERTTHATEMVAPVTARKPPLDGGTSSALPSARDASADPDASEARKPGQPPNGAAELVYPQFKKEQLDFVAAKAPPGQELEVELWVDDEGQVGFVELRLAKLSDEDRKTVEERLLKWQVVRPEARGRRYVLAFSSTEVATAQARSRPVHKPVPKPEMVAPRPRPPVPRPEMIPPRAPPKRK